MIKSCRHHYSMGPFMNGDLSSIWMYQEHQNIFWSWRYTAMISVPAWQLWSLTPETFSKLIPIKTYRLKTMTYGKQQLGSEIIRDRPTVENRWINENTLWDNMEMIRFRFCNSLLSYNFQKEIGMISTNEGMFCSREIWLMDIYPCSDRVVRLISQLIGIQLPNGFK